MRQIAKRWILPLLRYGLCAVAIVWLVRTVPWYDHVRLGDGHGPLVRLIEQRADAFVVERSGEVQTLPAEQVFHIEVAGQRVPEIERGIATVVPQINVTWALWSILLFAPVVALQTWRLIVMLAVQRVPLSFWTSTKLTFAGNFFNFALPGMTGGDLIKAYYLTHYTHLKTETVTTVFLDRAIGLLGLVLLAAGSIVLTQEWRQFQQYIVALAVICIMLAVGSVFVFSHRVRNALHLSDIVTRLPMGEQLLRVGRATVALRQGKRLVALSLAITMVLQAFCMISAAVMAWALGMHGSLSHYFIYISIGFLIAAVPISPPQAFGVMEYFYVQFFTQPALGNDPSQAVALALAVRMIQLVYALPGVLVPLLGAHLPSKAELAALEAGTAGNTAPVADRARLTPAAESSPSLTSAATRE